MELEEITGQVKWTRQELEPERVHSALDSKEGRMTPGHKQT